MDCRDNGEDDVGTNREIDGFEEPSPAAEDESVGSGGGGPRVSMTERLRDVMLGDGDGDLLLQNRDSEDRVMQWLHALDMQVMGACRADERSKPLFKLCSAYGGGVEDPLLAHLSQHFEPSEVEKLKLLGAELLGKMRDLLQRRPSIADLTGISESRLDYFATHLRGYLLGTTVDNAFVRYSGVPTSGVESTRSLQLLSSSKSLRARHSSNQAAKANSLCQGSLSPRVSSFKEGLPRSLSMRNAREKLRKLGENHLVTVENLSAFLPMPTYSSSFTCMDDEKSTEAVKFNPSAELCFLESLGGWKLPPSSSLPSQASSDCRPVFAPCYCWCPPSSAALKPSMVSSGNSTSLKESSLPMLSSLLPVVSSSLLIPTPSISLANLPQLELPAFFPDRLPLLPMPNSQPFPSFTPLICDPIVHIPVIDVFSAGQGYLVRAGPGVTTGIAPMLINPLIPETNSVLEESARETLRLLISSSGTTTGGLAGMLSDGNDVMKAVVSGSKGLYHRAMDVDSLSEGLAAIGLTSTSGKTPKLEVRTDHVDNNEESVVKGEKND